jgi:CRISPR-associated protein Csd1
MEYKEIAFLIVIDWDGNFKRFEDRRIDNKTCQQFLVAKHESRTSAPKANLLWDYPSYVLGLSDKDADNRKNQLCLQKFKDKVEEAHCKLPDNRELNAVYNFYQKYDENSIILFKEDRLWSSIEKDFNKCMSFIIEGEYTIVAEQSDIIYAMGHSSEKDKSNKDAICLVTGERAKIVTTSTATSIPGSQATAKLVAFQVNSGYDSYGKSQGANAPISENADFAVTTALNRLLEKKSRNKFQIGNRTYLFWSSTQSEASKLIENGMSSFFGRGSTEDDDPNRNIAKVRDTFMKIYSGRYPTNSDDRFFILGLSPNIARISVVYWQEISIKDFARNIVAHIDDMELFDGKPDSEQKSCAGIHSMMSAVALGGKSTDVQPNLPDAVIKSIVQHTPYPLSLYSASLRRILAEQSPSNPRVSILKAYLNRTTNINNKKLTVMLDKDNDNQGYLCGRLFAVLERIQFCANRQSSIRERYICAASATPAAVFPTLLNLSVHHSEKLDKPNNIFTDKIKSEIIQKISPDGFPAHLNLNDQGRFFVGYYHQRQYFFTANASSSDAESEEM